jgi:glyoxylase-like metal-dependent hydrolase (beta-lactamase superfamily II)
MTADGPSSRARPFPVDREVRVIVERSMDPEWLSNAYLVADGEGGTAIAIDSGAPLEPLFEVLDGRRLKMEAILTTHRHFDHAGGNDEWSRRTGAPVFALRAEVPHIPDARPLDAGEERTWGRLKVRVVPLPGHTSGQAGFLVEGVGLFTGDCLFAGSLGGTVGPASTGFEDARRAVLEGILSLPDETAIYPGHCESTSVGRERRENPFIRVMTGVDREGQGRCQVSGCPATVIVCARDYDGGSKVWVRFDDGSGDALVPGSRVRMSS